MALRSESFLGLGLGFPWEARSRHGRGAALESLERPFPGLAAIVGPIRSPSLAVHIARVMISLAAGRIKPMTAFATIPTFGNPPRGVSPNLGNPFATALLQSVLVSQPPPPIQRANITKHAPQSPPSLWVSVVVCLLFGSGQSFPPSGSPASPG